MKKTIFFLAILSCFLGCQKQHYAAGLMAVESPIMPIRMNSDTMHIVLTDYVPALYGDTSYWQGLQWTTGEAIEYTNLIGTPKIVREMDIINRDRSIHAITFHDKTGSFAIPVLPAKPVRQSLYSLSYEDGKLRVAFFDTVTNPTIEAYIQNTLIDHTLWQAEEDGSWSLDLNAISNQLSALQGRSFLRVFAEDETYLYNDLLLPLQDGQIVTDAARLNRHDQQAQVLYSVLIDRFYNGNSANDWKMNSPEVLDIVDYQGGDLAGITRKISEGYFDQLGINTIWISPITQNPWDAWGLYPFPNGNKYDSTKTYTKFSGYHGYWPIYATKLDDRFGTPDELRTLLDTAHAHEINIILDYVANHINWTVDYGTIKIHFLEEDSYIRISDYRLNNDHFYGTLNDNGRAVDFELYHTSSPNWSSYRWGYDDWYNDWYDPYYSRTRGDSASDSTTVEKPIRFVRGK